MKNIIKKITILILIFNCCSLFAQIQREHLVGNWLFDYENSLANMQGKAKTIFEKSSIVKEALEKTYRNRQITFNTDGTYFLRLVDGREMSGTWNIGEENNTLITITTQNQIENISILMLSNSVLVLKPEESKANLFFSQWYFTKI